MNLPNKLSLSRILLVPVFLLCLLAEQIFGVNGELENGVLRLASLVIVIFVAVTDWLDGYLARKHQLVSNLGKLLDPLADKIFVTAALVAFVEIGLVPAWAIALIIAREFLITGMRSLALEGGRLISADRLGKHKTGWQLGLIISAITVLTARHFLVYAGVEGNPMKYFNWFYTIAIWVPLVVTLILTVLSGWNYLSKNMDLISDHSADESGK